MACFIHGTLYISIEQAENLPNLDKTILNLNKKDVSDPFAVIFFLDACGGSWKVATTSVIDNNLNPVWNENFRIDVCHDITSVKVEVRDKDFVSSEILGTLSFPVNTIKSREGIAGKYDLLNNSRKYSGNLKLSMKLKFKEEQSYSYEVPECLFTMKKSNRVNLYQDAHCPNPFPNVSMASGYPYFPRSAWRDVYDSIMGAETFIYIIGWSVSAKISLLRWQGEDTTPLGHLLLAKAYEGVDVRLLLWDELTSNDIRKSGAMNTEDEETMTFFKGTPVTVKLAARDRYTKDILSTKNPFTKLCYTHHQKCVIVDTANHNFPAKRHALAYVGGLDLTLGRFDTPDHPLFRTLLNEHKDDFRNRIAETTSASGPREPWHDIHSSVEGPAAVDLLNNFQERWNKQGDNENLIDNLMKNAKIELNYLDERPGSWNVQVFRSINSDSAIFDWQTSVSNGLKIKKGRVFDDSIHRAYIHQIRRSKRFIYIENQYFLGSSHLWLDCKDANAKNLIPMEIVSHIEEKIKKNKRFVAYIVIPMFPEGKPADKVTQEILHWQYRTIQMMYHRIAAAIQDAGIDAHPQDYLLFFCLGKKETPDSVPSQLVNPENPIAQRYFKNRRLMIYVHSKMAIFDDEYIIIGSANINDRSMSGNRDTELAVGAYQPSCTLENSNSPNGNVSVFRKALWAEHIGDNAPITDDPSSLGTVRKMRSLGSEALNAYVDNNVPCTPHNLLIYPIKVNTNGTLEKRSCCKYIPDTEVSFFGARSKVFPSSLTT